MALEFRLLLQKCEYKQTFSTKLKLFSVIKHTLKDTSNRTPSEQNNWSTRMTKGKEEKKKIFPIVISIYPCPSSWTHIVYNTYTLCSCRELYNVIENHYVARFVNPLTNPLYWIFFSTSSSLNSFEKITWKGLLFIHWSLLLCIPNMRGIFMLFFTIITMAFFCCCYYYCWLFSWMHNLFTLWYRVV